jgi:hypothetical protein
LLLGSGIGLFLTGEVGFRAALGIPPVAYRLVAALLAVATTAIGVTVSGFAQLVALVALMVGLFIVEAATGARRSFA